VRVQHRRFAHSPVRRFVPLRFVDFVA
jgi:hypothetical protein